MSTKLEKGDLLTVSALAKALGISAQTVRRLEARGLAPLRDQHGVRLYLPSAIGQAKALTRRLRSRRRRKERGA